MAWRLHISNNEFVISNLRGENNHTLHIDRTRSDQCSLTVEQDATKLDLTQAQSEVIYGLVGTIKLLRGYYLIAIKDSIVVGRLNGCEIRCLKSISIYPFSTKKLTQDLPKQQQRDDENKCLELIQSVLSLSNFYFSTNYDLTHTVQRISEFNNDAIVRSKPLWERADDRFFWNKYLMEPFISAKVDEWIIPVMSGFVAIHETTIQDHKVSYCLISRRSCTRAGRRYTARGVDSSGNAANFAETEQILVLPLPQQHKNLLFSYVQTRGSIPVIWQQMVNMKYTPKIQIANDEELILSSFKKHFNEQNTKYGRQILISLVNGKGSERKLSDAYNDYTVRSGNPELRFVAWDFHHECRKMKYVNIWKLVDLVGDELEQMSYYSCEVSSKNASSLTHQKSVFRTNCMDCLDRTNVVQSVFARRALATQLINHGILPATFHPKNDFPQPFEFVFKNVWADNADAMSNPYSGTGAQKTDYTRTGKRSRAGEMTDLSYSAIRYYKNNFTDGEIQDGLDLFLGRYRIANSRSFDDSSIFTPREPTSSLINPIRKASLLLITLFFAWMIVGSMTNTYAPSIYFATILLALFLLPTTYVLAAPQGRKYVNKPSLVQDDVLAAAYAARSSTTVKVTDNRAKVE